MIPVGIFAKPPLPGIVKTRLIPDIGADKAAAVYRCCLTHTLETVRHSGLDYRLFLSQHSDGEFFEDEQYSLQRGANLGARMLHALHELQADSGDGAIIVGSDCLDLSVAHLQQAAQALANYELVLLPAVDGGYALIGCKPVNGALFEGVSWSSARVLRQTLANARRLGYRARQLETVRDIDRLQDLEHYPQLLALIASS